MASFQGQICIVQWTGLDSLVQPPVASQNVMVGGMARILQSGLKLYTVEPPIKDPPRRGQPLVKDTS